MLYTRFPIQPSKPSKHDQMHTIILGPVGCGKTALLNKICNTNYPCDQGIGSVTRGITENKIIFEYPFSLLDTPGINSI